MINNGANRPSCAIRLASPSRNSGIKNIPMNIKMINATFRMVFLLISRLFSCRINDDEVAGVFRIPYLEYIVSDLGV